jgi:NAD(P)-dependent dehydrogenase (short-subunit alcohol dehydrogenase family)
MTDLHGRVALVTGSAGGGIGRSIALALGRAGATVVLNYGTGRSGAAMEAAAAGVAAALDAMGAASRIVPADTSSAEQVAGLVDRIQGEFAGIDILVNNAGTTWKEQDFVDADPDRWRRALAAEVEGPAGLISRALPHMRSRRWGRIINIGIDLFVLDLLLAAVYSHPLHRYPHPFAVAKAARQHLTEVLAYTELRHGITINSIQPGIIEEIPLEEAVRLSAGETGERFYAGPSDVAAAAVFLCSDKARFLTNSVIRVPGNIYTRLHT